MGEQCECVCPCAYRLSLEMQCATVVNMEITVIQN